MSEHWSSSHCMSIFIDLLWLDLRLFQFNYVTIAIAINYSKRRCTPNPNQNPNLLQRLNTFASSSTTTSYFEVTYRWNCLYKRGRTNWLSMPEKSAKTTAEPARNTKWDKTRTILSFWLLGLCTNYIYNIMLSAAHDVISKVEHQVQSQIKKSFRQSLQA